MEKWQFYILNISARIVFPHTPKPAPTHLGVWVTEKQECLFEIAPALGSIDSFLVSPDGKTGIIRGNKCISTWNMENGRQINNFMCPEHIETNRISPDGTCLITSAKGLIQIWDLATGRELSKFQTSVLTGNMTISPNGKTIAMISANGIDIVDSAKGNIVSTLKCPGQIKNVNFQPNEEVLIVEISFRADNNADQKCLIALELITGKELFKLKAISTSSPIAITRDMRRAVSVILG